MPQEIERNVKYKRIPINYKLPNRYEFYSQLGQKIETYDKYVFKRFAILFLDVDNFASINHTVGRSEGDSILSVIGQRIASSLDKGDMIAKTGGDEYLILINDSNLKSVHKTADKLLDLIRQPIVINNYKLDLTASIGCSIFPIDGKNPDTLIASADVAMVFAKENGKNQVLFYNGQMESTSNNLLKINNDLNNAIKNNELELYYQPQVDCLSGHIFGMEVLLRWKHPVFGYIMPDQFIPIAEKTGLIINIGKWIIKAACEQAKKWESEGLGQYQISINMSVLQLTDSELTDYIHMILCSTSVMPRHLKFEVTETWAIKDMDKVVEMMKNLRDLGVGFSIDDFGTEYSSLSYIKHMPVDVIKIDKSFVEGINKNTADEVIIKTIIELAKKLNMDIIAEGVESQEQVIFLRDIGCFKMQGYYYYKPMSAYDLSRILLSN